LLHKEKGNAEENKLSQLRPAGREAGTKGTGGAGQLRLGPRDGAPGQGQGVGRAPLLGASWCSLAVAGEQEQQSRRPLVAHPSPPRARLRDAGAAERVREGEPEKE
jgi:hypothetical protein